MRAEPQRLRVRQVSVHPDTAGVGYNVAATYDEQQWEWTATLANPESKWGEPPRFAASDPYRAIGEAVAWIVARSKGEELPPAPLPSFTIKLDAS